MIGHMRCVSVLGYTREGYWDVYGDTYTHTHTHTRFVSVWLDIYIEVHFGACVCCRRLVVFLYSIPITYLTLYLTH